MAAMNQIRETNWAGRAFWLLPLTALLVVSGCGYNDVIERDEDVKKRLGELEDRLKELEGENARLKRIVADKELQIQALKELGRGNW